MVQKDTIECSYGDSKRSGDVCCGIRDFGATWTLDPWVATRCLFHLGYEAISIPDRTRTDNMCIRSTLRYPFALREYECSWHDSNVQQALVRSQVLFPIELQEHIRTEGIEPSFSAHQTDFLPLEYVRATCQGFEPWYPYGMSVFKTDAVPIEPTRHNTPTRIRTQSLQFWRLMFYH